MQCCLIAATVLAATIIAQKVDLATENINVTNHNIFLPPSSTEMIEDEKVNLMPGKIAIGGSPFQIIPADQSVKEPLPSPPMPPQPVLPPPPELPPPPVHRLFSNSSRENGTLGSDSMNGTIGLNRTTNSSQNPHDDKQITARRFRAKGLIFTHDALENPDLERTLRAVRAVFELAGRGFNASDAHRGTGRRPVDHPNDLKRFTFTLDSRILATNKVKFISHTDRLQQTLNATYLKPLASRLDRSGLFSKSLTWASDAHANIITQIEFQKLQEVGVTMDQIETIAKQNYIAYTQMGVQCLGRQKKLIQNQEEEIVFMRVQAKEWKMVRQDVAKLLQHMTNATQIFDAQKYNPHVVVAFTGSGGWVEDEIGMADEHCFAEVEITKDHHI